jgi:hypothetical protein
MTENKNLLCTFIHVLLCESNWKLDFIQIRNDIHFVARLPPFYKSIPEFYCQCQEACNVSWQTTNGLITHHAFRKCDSWWHHDRIVYQFRFRRNSLPGKHFLDPFMETPRINGSLIRVVVRPLAPRRWPYSEGSVRKEVSYSRVGLLVHLQHSWIPPIDRSWLLRVWLYKTIRSKNNLKIRVPVPTHLEPMRVEPNPRIPLDLAIVIARPFPVNSTFWDRPLQWQNRQTGDGDKRSVWFPRADPCLCETPSATPPKHVSEESKKWFFYTWFTRRPLFRLDSRDGVNFSGDTALGMTWTRFERCWDIFELGWSSSMSRNNR